MQPDFSNELEEYKYILFHTVEGRPCREYLAERKISPDTATKWQLGYAPVNYNPQCYRSLLKENVTHFWKKLNGRLVIPIFNSNGKLVSLSGRTIFNLFPKYDHYPFPATRVLFGLYQNKDYIRKENRAILTEGQLDVISAWQKGIRTVISSFGAHSSVDHFALLSRYTQNVYILYDGDKAGKRGMLNIEKLDKGDLHIEFLNNFFNFGEDLDSWIQKHSINEFNYKLENNKIILLKNKIINLKNRSIGR